MPDISPCIAQLADTIKDAVSRALHENYTPDEVIQIAACEEARADFAEWLLECIKALPKSSDIRQTLRGISRHPSVQLSALREAVKHLTNDFGMVPLSQHRELALLSA